MHHLIVGLGAIAHAHARALKQLDQRVSFCSRDLARASMFQKTYGGEAAYAGLPSALDNPDIQSCVLCVPHDLHEKYVAAAAAAGKHILLEKPIAHTLDSARRIVDIATRHGKTIMLAEQMDYMPFLANVKRLVGGQRRVTYFFHDHNDFMPDGWRASLAHAGGGVLLDLGVHYVSFAVKAFGPIVSCRRKVLEIIENSEVPFSERLFIRHESGAEGEVDVAWRQTQVEQTMEVVVGRRTLTYTPGHRFAMCGFVPQFVALRATTGRLQMTVDYLARCAAPHPTVDIGNALPMLEAMLSA